MERILRLISHGVLTAHTEWLLGGDRGTSVPPVQYVQKIVKAGSCSFPGLPVFWSSGFIQYNTRKRKSANTGKAWEHLSREWRPVDARWTYSIEHSNDSQDSWSSQDRQYSASLVRNSLYCLLHTSWLMGTSTSRPPDIIHVISVLPRFSCSSASMYYTEWKPKNKKRGRPGNKASCLVVVAQCQHTGCTHQVSWVRFQAIFSLFYFPSQTSKLSLVTHTSQESNF